MEVRKATPEDAAGIARVQERGWQAAYRHVFPAEELDRGGFIHADRWTERLIRPPAGWTTFVAEHDGEVVGFTSVGPSRDETGVGELYAIYVHPSRWGDGAGRALIASAERSLRESGFPSALLWVLEGNERAERFYDAAGWERDGEKVDDFQGATVTESRYRKQL